MMQYSQMFLFCYVLGWGDCLQAMSQRGLGEGENKSYLNTSYLHECVSERERERLMNSVCCSGALCGSFPG